MKTMTLILLSVGSLLCSAPSRSETIKKKEVKEEIKPPRPSFPLFILPSFSSFSLPSLSFPQIPYLQALSPSNRQSYATVKATKTEYLEVTRRQTVHPVCYTAYEVKSPCLSNNPLDIYSDEYDNFDFDTIHQTNENFQNNELRKSIQATPVLHVNPAETAVPEDGDKGGDRYGKYLQFITRGQKDTAKETSTKIEGSEFVPVSVNFGNNRQSTEYTTKTVLVTKLEKYTDHRVTATLLAINCLPVDRNIPMCQSHPNPIREAPDFLLENSDQHSTNSKTKPVFPSKLKLSPSEIDKEIIKTVNAVKKLTQQEHKLPSFVLIDRKDTKVDDEISETSVKSSESNTDEIPVEDTTQVI